MSGRVIVVGSVNVDLVVSVERLPGPGETVTGGEFARFDGGKGGTRAGGDDPGTGREPLAIQRDGVIVDETGLAEVHVDAELGEPLRRVVALDRLDHLLHAGHHPFEIDGGKGELRQAEVLGSTGRGPDTGAADQGLGRDAAAVEAVAGRSRSEGCGGGWQPLRATRDR